MNVNRLERVTTMIQRLRDIDAQTKELHLLARRLSNGERDVSISFLVPDAKEEKKAVLDADGSLITEEQQKYRNSFFASYSLFGVSKPTEPVKPPPPSYRVTDVSAIRVLATVLQGLQDERAQVVSQLQKDGLKVA